MGMYKGYNIHVPRSGGKAGKGYNLTTTIQVRRDGLIVKSFKVDAGNSLSGVIQARLWVDDAVR